MKRRAVRDNALLPDELGQDSFLDTVSNLVGVLIILVVVVGAHARNISRGEDPLQDRKQALDAIARDVEKNVATEGSVKSDNAELRSQIRKEEEMAQLRSVERTQVLMLLTQLEAQLSARQAKKSQAEQEALARRATIRQLAGELSDLQEQAESLRAEEKNTVAIDHYPTPIAKTVFRDDVHFQLKAGKIVPVPLDELIQLMRNEWETKAEKLKTESEVRETVGPVEGFRLQYELIARQVVQQTSAGPIVQRAIEFDHFEIMPLLATIGEPVAVATEPTSRFFSRIQQLNPQQHTISIWVYPDSYAEFNQLKVWLFERGFQTASWPLSSGGLISGGPKGHHTTAQ